MLENEAQKREREKERESELRDRDIQIVTDKERGKERYRDRQTDRKTAGDGKATCIINELLIITIYTNKDTIADYSILKQRNLDSMIVDHSILNKGIWIL